MVVYAFLPDAYGNGNGQTEREGRPVEVRGLTGLEVPSGRTP